MDYGILFSGKNCFIFTLTMLKALEYISNIDPMTKRISSLLLFVICLLFVLGCEKNKITEKKLVGDWNSIEWVLVKNDTFDIANNNTFTANITLSYADNGSFDVFIESENFDNTFTGTWNLSNDRLEMNYDGENGVVGFFSDNLASKTEIYTVLGLTDDVLTLKGAVETTSVLVVNNR